MASSERSNPSLYEQLLALPYRLVGEILGGQLHTQPRPADPYAIAGSSLGDEILGPAVPARPR